MDIEARKQLLLTRIALERVQWVHDVEQVKQAANPKSMAARAIRAAVPDGLLSSVFGPSSGGKRHGGADLGMRAFRIFMLWRRYSILITLVGGMLSRAVAGKRVKRVVTLATVVAGIGGGIWLTLQRRRRLA